MLAGLVREPSDGRVVRFSAVGQAEMGRGEREVNDRMNDVPVCDAKGWGGACSR